MDIPIEDGSGERVSTSNKHETGTDKTGTDKTGTGKSSKNTRSLTETMQLIRKKEDARRFASTNDHGQNRNQLSLLLDDLGDVIDDIGDDVKYFDFHVAQREFPQLWIDETTFVMMARDGVGFRLFKQTRAGRILLRESRGRDDMAEAIVHYMVERLSHVENEKMQAQQVSSYGNEHTILDNKMPDNKMPDNKMPDNKIPESIAPEYGEHETAMMESEPTIIVRRSRLRSFVWFLVGFLTGALTLLALAWFRTDISGYLSTLQS